jgi:hypothetical protein
MLSQRTLLLLLVAVVAVATTSATDVDSNNIDTTSEHKRVRRHRNVLQISEADVSELNSLWEQDGFGQQTPQQRHQHSRILGVGDYVMKGKGSMMGKKEKKDYKKGKGKMDMEKSKKSKGGKGKKSAKSKGSKKGGKGDQSFSFYF